MLFCLCYYSLVVIMTLYRYDLLFKDMVSGVTGVGSIIQLEAIPASTCLNLKEH